MKLSIVTTLYLSQHYIHEFHQRATKAANELAGDDYEIIYVNDGSPDDSLSVAVDLAEKDEHILVVDLSRNFGHHKAMMTGLSYSRGELVFLVDSDLEEKPEWLNDFSKLMAEKKNDVIYGVQKKRKGGVFERWSGYLFYQLFSKLTDLQLPQNIITARLMSRRYVDSLLLHQERELFLAGLWQITGFDQNPCLVVKSNTSDTTYSFRQKLSLLTNSVTSFSNVPLAGIFYVGLTISFFAASFFLYLVINWVLFFRPASGWTSVMASIWLLGGLIISFIGIIGIYLSKIFSETKQRPYTIVRKVYAKGK